MPRTTSTRRMEGTKHLSPNGVNTTRPDQTRASTTMKRRKHKKHVDLDETRELHEDDTSKYDPFYSETARRHVGDTDMYTDEIAPRTDHPPPSMRRKRGRSDHSLSARSSGSEWEKNLSNAQLSEDEIKRLEKLTTDRALRSLERTGLWLRPCAFMLRLCKELCCTYRIEIGLRGKYKKAIGDPTKMLRQNIYGLFLGILIGFGSYLLFSVTFAHNPRLSTLLSAYVMLISVFGIAFSEDFRCVTLLTMPYLAASRIRWLLMLYASSLSITGPGLNFLHNSGNFRNAIACILAQVSTNMLLIQKLTVAPFSLLKSQLDQMIGSLNQMLARLRFSLFQINFSLFRVQNIMTQQANWIQSLVEACGDPVALKNQCLSFMNNIYFNCKSSLGAFQFVCGMVRQFAADTCKGNLRVTEICAKQKDTIQGYNPKPIDENWYSDVQKSMDEIVDTVGQQNMSLEGNFDQYDKMVIESDDTVISILQKRMDAFIATVEHGKYIISWVLVIWTLLTMVQLVVQAAMFRRSWIKKDMFDNVYITSAFVEQEKRCITQGLVPTVPLIRKEKKRYRKFSSFGWTATEKQKAFKAFLILIMWMSTLTIVLVSDYAMYEVLVTIKPVFSKDFSSYGARSSMSQDFEPEQKQVNKPQVQGSSSFASIVRSLLGMLNPLKDLALDVDAAACSPTATPPDKRTNIAVMVMMVLTILSIFFEVYILRIRHIILLWYYPKRGVQRAAWLRTYIRNNRGLFHRLIHKFRSVDVKPGRKAPNVTWFGKLLFRKPLLRKLLAMVGIERIMCAFCSEEGNPAKKAVFEENFARCVECGAYFCRVCQVDLDSICMICRTPLFALAVEVDLEQFSSDEEFEAICARYLRRAEQTTLKAQPRGKRGEANKTRVSISRKG